MAEPQTKKVFVIQEIGWAYNDEYYDCWGEMGPVKAFTSRERAEAFWFEHERAAWQEVGNPFVYTGSFENATSLSEEQFAAGLEALGIFVEPVDGWASLDVGQWFGPSSPLSLEQQLGVWRLFDKVRFYEILEIDLAAAPGAGP